VDAPLLYPHASVEAAVKLCVFMITEADKSKLIGSGENPVRYNRPVTVPMWTIARAVFGCYNTGIVGSNPTYVSVPYV
jgi:hypothetical protein